MLSGEFFLLYLTSIVICCYSSDCDSDSLNIYSTQEICNSNDIDNDNDIDDPNGYTVRGI